MADTTGDKIMLKALVRKWQNQVLFIESDDFADVLFSFLTLPIGTIIRLGQKHPVPVRFGCMNNLYSTVSDMDASLFRNETCRDLLLCPRNWADSHCKNLKLKIDTGEPLRYFLCSRNCNLLESDDGMCDSKGRGKKRKVYVPKKEKEIKSYSQKEDTWSLISYYKDAICRCGARMDKEVNLSVPLGGGAFLKERAGLIISDDLQVMPPGSIVSLFQKLGVRHGETIVEMNFSVGVDEVTVLLNCYICHFGGNFVYRWLLTLTMLSLFPGSEIGYELISITDTFVRYSAEK